MATIKIPVDDFNIIEDAEYSNNFKYDQILKLSYDQSAYSNEKIESKKNEQVNSEMNKYFSIHINRLSKSIRCVPFNESFPTDFNDRYFDEEKLKIYRTESDNFNNENKDFFWKFNNSNEVEMFKDLKVNNMETKKSADEKSTSSTLNVESDNMDDWLDDLLS